MRQGNVLRRLRKEVRGEPAGSGEAVRETQTAFIPTVLQPLSVYILHSSTELITLHVSQKFRNEGFNRLEDTSLRSPFIISSYFNPSLWTAI